MIRTRRASLRVRIIRCFILLLLFGGFLFHGTCIALCTDTRTRTRTRRGLIGPSRQFGSGSIYHPQLYAIIIGAFLPVPFWLWQRKYPNSWIKYISTPVVLNGVASIPPATGINYSSWFAVGFIFQYWIRKRNFAWWSKFNYVTSAALDSGECMRVLVCGGGADCIGVGTVISLIVIFFTLQVSALSLWFG